MPGRLEVYDVPRRHCYIKGYDREQKYSFHITVRESNTALTQYPVLQMPGHKDDILG